MNSKRMVLIGALVAVILIAIPLTVFIANQQQDVRSRANSGTLTNAGDIPTSTPIPTNTPAATATLTPSPTTAATPTPTASIPSPTLAAVSPTASACATPDTVSSVDFSYPSCVGTQCNFTQASCSWAAVNGAVSYSVKITQVESGTVTATTSVNAPTTTYAFAVEQGKTYRCDITAINSCGASGQAGSAQALCSVDGQVGQPSPTTKPQVIPTMKPAGDIHTATAVGIGGVILTVIGGLLYMVAL